MIRVVPSLPVTAPLLFLLLLPPSGSGQEILDVARGGDAAAVQALLQEDPSLIRARDDRGRTPLHLAAEGGHAKVVSLILAREPEIDALDHDGSTSLHLAVRSGERETVELLLDHGADPNLRGSDDGLSPTELAFQEESWRRSSLVRLLLEGGGALDPGRTYGERMNALDLAVEVGNAELVRVVVDAGADVNETLYPAAPLTMAALNGYTEIVETLVSARADVNVSDPMGGTPLRWAVERGHLAVARILLAHGAEPRYVESSLGRSLLHLAVLAGRPEVVDQLLERGASPNATDNHGRTPLDYASRYGHETVAEQLADVGAVHGDEVVVERYGISPYLTREMGDGEAVAWYLNHRGWTVRTRNGILVFDAEEFGVTRPREPSLANGFLTSAELAQHPVTAIFSAYHGAPGEPAYIHELEDSLPTIRYVHNARDGWRGSEATIYLQPGADTLVGPIRIRAVEVMRVHPALGYLVEVDGLFLYYSGFPVQNRSEFAEAVRVLAGATDRVDMAILRVPEGDPEKSGFKDVLEALNPRAVLLFDVGGRVQLLQGAAGKVAEWGLDAEIFLPENPGDTFVYPGHG